MLKFMKVMTFVAIVVVLTACSKNEASKQATSEAPMEQMSKDTTTAVSAQAVGVITAIDTKENLLTINHEAIPAIKWPAMTMGFKVADTALLNGLVIGQKINFELKAEGETYTVVAVKIQK